MYLFTDLKEMNERYPTYTHCMFTAGDTEQLLSRMWSPEVIGQSFRGAPQPVIQATAQYIFDKFKKGIFVRILNNRLHTFLPFSKKKYENDFVHLIRPPPRAFYDEIAQREGYPRAGGINHNISEWYANNGLIRNEYPACENDTNYLIIHDMLTALCAERKVDNAEFFINKRDFPLFRKDGTEPYDAIHGKGARVAPQILAPLFSHSSKPDEFLDILFPTPDDWHHANPDKTFVDTQKLGRFTPTSTSTSIHQCVFRGSSTGLGVDIATNPRLKACSLSHPLLDAGITKWNLRPRYDRKTHTLVTISKELTDRIGLKPPLTIEEQCKYEFLLHIQGHVSAFRLGIELAMPCCMLKVDSDYKLWFEEHLQPFTHYIPIKRDLSDLISTLEQTDSETARRLALQANALHSKLLSRDAILDYLQGKINALSNETYTTRHVYTIPSPFIPLPKMVEESWDILVKNKKTCVYKCTDAGLVFKQMRENELKVLQVLQKSRCDNACVPRLIMGLSGVTGYIDGLKLSDAMPLLTTQEIVEIIVEVAYFIESAQLRFGLSHNDLSPWNVIVSKTNTHPFHQFVTTRGVYTTSHHSLHASIIDYEYSSCVDRCGKTWIVSHQQPFRRHPMKDIIEFLINCISCLLPLEQHDLLKTLASFVFPKADRSTPLKTRVANLRSYDRLQRLSMKPYDNMTPIHLVEYLTQRGLYKGGIRRLPCANVYSLPYPSVNKTIRVCTGKTTSVFTNESLEDAYLIARGKLRPADAKRPDVPSRHYATLDANTRKKYE